MTRLSRRALLPTALGVAALAFPASAAGPDPLPADAPGTTLEAGIHRVDSNVTIRGDLLLKPGATILVAAGRTLTLLGGLIAPIAPIFTGPGLVDLNRSRVAAAHPEWWGAVTGDGTHDCLPALHACLRAHPVMRLLAADYFIAAPFVVDRAFCRIAGAGFRGTQGSAGTRIIVTDARADVMRVGPASRPASVNDFLQNVDIRALALCRSVPVDAAAQAPAGLRAQFLLFAHIEQVSAFEHAIGFVARGLVRSTMHDCVAFRSLRGRQDGAVYRGFLLDGSDDIGLAGGNASLFLTDCNSTIGGEPAIGDGVGLLLDGAFADTFVVNFETAGLATGIRVEGRAKTLGARARNGHVNLHLRMPIIDQCAQAGIDIRDTSAHALIDIAEPYVAVGPSAQAALRFDAARGAITVSGGQLVGNTNSAAGGKALGVWARDSRGLQFYGLKILEHARPAMLQACSGFALRLLIANPAAVPGGTAVAVQDCAHGTVAILLSGTTGAFKAGVAIDGATAQLNVDATGIDAQAVGGASRRVVAGGRALAVPFRDASLTIEGN